MDSFSISQLSQFSGIKPHTIRIWEQRYNALRPTRSEGNTRLYDGDQLRRLLNIVSLMGPDRKVSELCSMSDEELFRLIEEKEEESRGNDLNDYFVTQLVAAGMDFDEPHFEKIFSHCVLRYGVRDSYLKVIYPMLQRLGLMWASDRLPPAHEHFVSNVVRRKLFTAMDSLPPEKSGDDSWLLFLPENEFHEISLLFAGYLIRLSGKKVYYLGANVPLASLVLAVEETAPSNLLLFFVHHDLPEKVEEYLNILTDHFSDQNIYLSGNENLLRDINLKQNLNWIPTVADLESELNNNF